MWQEGHELLTRSIISEHLSSYVSGGDIWAAWRALAGDGSFRRAFCGLKSDEQIPEGKRNFELSDCHSRRFLLAKRGEQKCAHCTHCAWGCEPESLFGGMRFSMLFAEWQPVIWAMPKPATGSKKKRRFRRRQKEAPEEKVHGCNLAYFWFRRESMYLQQPQRKTHRGPCFPFYHREGASGR
jgi:hypothetical protein